MIRLIRESMDPSIPSWLKGTMSELSKPVYRGRYARSKSPSDFSLKVDTANAVYNPMPIPRTSNEFNKVNKDPNRATVVRFKDDYGRDHVWVVGFNDGSLDYVRLNGMDKSITRHASKNILPNVIDYGYLEFSDDLKGLRQSRSENRPEEDRRANAQYIKKSHEPEKDYVFGKGYQYAQGPTMQTWETKSGYDKSGYKIVGIEKYKRMLAELGLRNYNKTMDRIYDSYEGLTSAVRLCRGSKYKLDTYRSLVDHITGLLANVEGKYQEYEKAANQSYGEDDDLRWSMNYANTYIRPRVEDCIKKLRDYSKMADEFILHLTEDDWTERDYNNFAWKFN